MRETRFVVTEKVLREIRTVIAARRISCTTWSLVEETVCKILDGLEEGAEEVFLRLKNGDPEERHGTAHDEYESQLDSDGEKLYGINLGNRSSAADPATVGPFKWVEIDRGMVRVCPVDSDEDLILAELETATLTWCLEPEDGVDLSDELRGTEWSSLVVIDWSERSES